jgi:hypothetical protein
MNSSPQASTLRAKLALLLFFASLGSIYLISGTLSPVRAQASEREFVDKLPKHLPIKVKIKKEKEKAVKDLNNEKWPRDLELEITNTGEKPIYFLQMSLIMPDVTVQDGTPISFSIFYGPTTKKRGPIDFQASPEDVPINPGETYVFRIPKFNVESWERAQQRENRPDAKRLILDFQILSFGDGTGFAGTTGVAMPRAPRTKSSLNRCEPEPSFSDSSGGQGQQASRRRWPMITPPDDLPATFLLANFLSTDSSQPISLKQ